MYLAEKNNQQLAGGYLCDKSGNPIPSHHPKAFKIKVISITAINHNKTLKKVKLSISGFINTELSKKYPQCRTKPIPFTRIQTVELILPDDGKIDFKIINFHCVCVDLGYLQFEVSFCLFAETYKRVNLLIKGTTIQSRSTKQLSFSTTRSNCKFNKHCIHVEKIYDWVKVPTSFTLIGKDHLSCPLKVKTQFYYAIANGKSRIYTESHGEKGYESTKIYDPIEVTIINLYVNGVLQDPASYKVKRNQLIFQTEDVPRKKVPIIIQFIKVFNHDNQLLNGETEYFTVLSTGSKIPFPKHVHLPNPDEYSYVNLYINGVLQPQENYTITDGELILLTEEDPRKHVPIIVQFVKIYQINGRTVTGEVATFCAASDGKSSIYKEDAECLLCSPISIPEQSEYSFSNLFINGVLQPNKNYVADGQLELITSNLPIKHVPIILQLIKLNEKNGILDCCEMHKHGNKKGRT
ncbi:hypothetical protein J2S74_002708 [Evansella vedderi]|uniref:DUF4183 domain-containing protein n=1 Tax=Evansella vedderi TaxID=38282 RepID=A0ABT9ZX65_9BACI|nr:DUF4183 domain-containing protein [Evansella vedderi]MDQ0255326.1 hypothetical protein [Evansella vedderi]